MNSFTLSYLSKFMCCHPSHFDTNELLCSSLLNKYLNQRQENSLVGSGIDVEPRSNYQPRAPYYYGDLAAQSNHYQHPLNRHWGQFDSSKYSIMDGIRVQIKNQSRARHSNQLRSPNVHRSDEFKVSLRGWLYRLEGAALKQWKRRWCVLAEYCLFYYKDIAEEKLLGSLLLPSYKISPCFSSDGISKKYAFKAEHNNMKTYYFAADTKEIQQQWMNALSMASIMQLSAIFPTASQNTNQPAKSSHYNSTASKGPTSSVESSRNSNNEKSLLEDESGFVSYQAKRLEANDHSLAYGLGYYGADYSRPPLTMYNSVGLPPVYSDQMYINGYITTKPQRHYYDMMMPYDMSSSTLAEMNLINQNSIDYLSPDSQDFLPVYPEYLDHQMNGFNGNLISRMPPRPHSADFLERSQEEELDEECQIAFAHKSDYLHESNLQPKIMPTRPKSSIERYVDPFGRLSFHKNEMKAYPKFEHQFNALENAYDANEQKNYTKYTAKSLFASDDTYPKWTNKENVSLSTISPPQPDDRNKETHLPLRPPLPEEYASRLQNARETSLTSQLESTKPATTKKEAKKDTTYTSDDEKTPPEKEKSSNHGEDNKSVSKSTEKKMNQNKKESDLTEISKEEYFRASQLFYRRQSQMQYKWQSTTHAQGESEGAQQGTSHTYNHGDWSEIGLPRPDSSMVKPASNEAVESPRSSSNESTVQSHHANVLSTMSNSTNVSSDSPQNQVKVKFGHKVRVYRKPRPPLVSDTSTPPCYYQKANVKEEESNSSESLNLKPNQVRSRGSESGSYDTESENRQSIGTAPYYYSDLLTEEQKTALKQKLGNFATPPPLLSRCPAISNPRLLGTTSLTSKAKQSKGDRELAESESPSPGEKSKLCSLTSPNKRPTCAKEETAKKGGSAIATNLVDLLRVESQSPLIPTYENYDIPKSVLSHSLSKPNEVLIQTQPKSGTELISPSSSRPLNRPEATSQSGSLDSACEMKSNSKKIKRRKKRRPSDNENNNVSDSEMHHQLERYRKARSFNSYKRFSISAADYIGKSQEELVLMLIQLRRKQSELSKSCEKLRLQMEGEEKMMELEPHRRDQYQIQVNELKQKLSTVEKEYIFREPIIETIDNMIKSKSKQKWNKKKAASTSVLDKVVDDVVDLNDNIRLNNLPNDVVMPIGGIDSISTESASEACDNIENLKKQQKVLEGELDRVRGMLTHSTKQLEEKAVENAQMEQEMMIARNKLKQVLDNEEEAMEIKRSSQLEKELVQINQVIDDLHNRRKDLNSAIENLKNSELKYSHYKKQLSSNQTNEKINYVKQEQNGEHYLCPLYENIANTQIFWDTENSNTNVDIANNNRFFEESENDDFFTLNINLNNQSKQYKLYSNNKAKNEINNNELQQNLNTMCEFDPTKDIAYSDSIVDQQINQIYNYQPSFYPLSQKNGDIKTVREVKRESERRKFHNQQQLYKANLYRGDRLANYDCFYYCDETSPQYYCDTSNGDNTGVEDDTQLRFDHSFPGQA